MSAPQRRRLLTYILMGSCGLIVVVSLGLSAWTFVRQSNADAIRQADRKAQSTTQVGQCFQQVKNAPQVMRILEIVDILASNSITANKQALDASDAGDPLRATRIASLKRLVPARNDLRAFIRRTAEQAPTTKQCNQLADELGVDPAKLKQ